MLKRMKGEGFRLPSYAKINWLLRVRGRRDDGFHELCTIFQTVSLADEIAFEESDVLTLACDDVRVPVDETNLIVKAARLLQNESGTTRGARLRLAKRIPSPGGLGGGSSNAAVALVGLARLWDLRAGFDDLAALAARLGSDVPFFLFGGTAAATGRGTDIAPVADIDEKYMLIVAPNVEVPTAEAFARLGAPRLTNIDPKSILKICQTEAENFRFRQSAPVNDFEPSVFAFAPEIERVKETLLNSGAARAAMSGSGASVYAVFDKEETRQATLKALESESDWRKFAVATVSREAYRAALFNV